MPTTKRRYTRKEKLAAVLAAEMGGVVQAEKQTGIRESTIRYWMQLPEFAEVRAKTREDLREEVSVVAHLAWGAIAKALAAGTMEPRDAIFAAEKATNLQLLMGGEATARTENVSITDGLDDHEREALNDAIRGELARRSDERTAEPAVGTTGEDGAEGTAG
jgi:hypothetical protein